MVYGLPSHGQQDWDDELNNSMEALKSDVDVAKATSQSAISTANAASSAATDRAAEATISAASAGVSAASAASSAASASASSASAATAATTIANGYTAKPQIDAADYALLQRQASVGGGVSWTTSQAMIARTLGWTVVTDASYGATGDGSDQSVQIQAAVDATIAANRPIYFPPGVYGMSGIEHRPGNNKNIEWHGAGDTSSILKATAGGGVAMLTVDGGQSNRQRQLIHGFGVDIAAQNASFLDTAGFGGRGEVTDVTVFGLGAGSVTPIFGLGKDGDPSLNDQVAVHFIRVKIRGLDTSTGVGHRFYSRFDSVFFDGCHWLSLGTHVDTDPTTCTAGSHLSFYGGCIFEQGTDGLKLLDLALGGLSICETRFEALSHAGGDFRGFDSTNNMMQNIVFGPGVYVSGLTATGTGFRFQRVRGIQMAPIVWRAKSGLGAYPAGIPVEFNSPNYRVVIEPQTNDTVEPVGSSMTGYSAVFNRNDFFGGYLESFDTQHLTAGVTGVKIIATAPVADSSFNLPNGTSQAIVNGAVAADQGSGSLSVKVGAAASTSGVWKTLGLASTRQGKTAAYAATLGELIACDTTSGTFAATLPAASTGKGRVIVKWTAGSAAPTVALTGSDHINTSGGPTSATLSMLNQSVVFESDGTSLWTVAAGDLPLTGLDARYAPIALELASGQVVPPRDQIITANVASVTGSLFLTYFTADKSETTSTLTVGTGSTAAGATPTICRMGLYTVDGPGNITLVASTPNDTSLFAAANTAYAKALSTPYARVAGTRYATGLIVVSGAALPNFHGKQYPATNWFSALARLGPPVIGRVTGQTDLPASVTVGSIGGYQASIGMLLS